MFGINGRDDIHMVDFGFASKYVENGKHVSRQEVDNFRGNMIFASLNQLKFYNTTRRDDLQSLCYMLIYLVNQGQITGIDLDQHLDRNESFKLTR